MLTISETIDHFEYAIRATVITCAACIMAWLIGCLVSDREVGE